MYRVLAIALCLLVSSASAQNTEMFDRMAVPQVELFDTAMSQVGLTAADIGFDQDEMATWGGDRWRGSFFTMFHKHPLKLPKYGDLIFASLKDNAGNLTGLATAASRWMDHPVRRGLIGDALEAYQKKDTANKASMTGGHNFLAGSQYVKLRAKIDVLWNVIDDDAFPLPKVLADENKGKTRSQVIDYLTTEKQELNDMVEDLAERMDYDRLAASAQDLAEVAKRIADSLEFATFPKIKLELKSRRGLIVVGTTGDDQYEYLEAPLLIIDGGGNDTYKFGGFPDEYPVSIIVDASGNDQYLAKSEDQPAFGGGVLGISILIDKSGDDKYIGLNASQGCGVLGAGMLLDGGGNDLYTGKNLCQGAGVFGLGILSDLSGNDSLYCLTTSQGYAYSRGCGVLVNAAGDDKYVAEDDTVFSPSPQTAEHNSSLAQGVGFGKRADYVDGHSWAGGFGVLCDIEGKDSYSAGLFAQGCAYWFSVGMLLDGAGDDVYDGIWYVQGSGAHFGVGYLDDFAGNDTYTATMNMAQGAGHDFTIGFFNERAGNDTYNAPTLSLGGGNANGIGIFHDYSGDDVYTSKGGATLGKANGEIAGARGKLPVMGIFIDGGGTDTYNQPWATNGTKWIGPKSNEDGRGVYELGVGVDR